MVTIDLAVLLSIVIVLRLRRRTEARSRRDEQLTVLIVLAFGVLVASTWVGDGVRGVLEAVVDAFARIEM